MSLRSAAGFSGRSFLYHLLFFAAPVARIDAASRRRTWDFDRWHTCTIDETDPILGNGAVLNGCDIQPGSHRRRGKRW
ncbi:MAG: hypothetical protein H6669_05420 [Ardenticatenaceae bacterium]|nr:hypothetical protein [Ardenticatenaceae bacterium]